MIHRRAVDARQESDAAMGGFLQAGSAPGLMGLCRGGRAVTSWSRAHRERPRRRRSAEQRDELAALHGLAPKAKDHGPSIAGLGAKPRPIEANSRSLS